MSKYVKNLMIDDLRQRFTEVSDVVLVSLEGVDANANNRLRAELSGKGIQLLVIKNSLARRATEGTVLEPAFEGATGPTAVVWGGEDIVSMAKEVIRLAKEKDYEPFGPRGGVMDGARLSPEEVEAVSKWPSRTEQLSILAGQILSVGAVLAGQLNSAGGSLAGQIKQKSEGAEGEPQTEG